MTKSSLFSMLKLFKKSAVEIAGYNPYSELVFGGWDYNIANKQSAILKSKSIVKVRWIFIGFCIIFQAESATSMTCCLLFRS